MTKQGNWRAGYLASLKSMDTEEHIDLAFYRPIGYVWARIAMRLGITPNAITIAAIFLGIGAAACFFFPVLWINICGMLLLIWANSFDSADGQLARLTKQYSRIGRILDGLCGDIWFFAIYFAICMRETLYSPFFSEHHWMIWTLAAVTGLFHAKQAAMADYYRQFHLYFLKGENASELESLHRLLRQYAEIPAKGHFWKKLVMRFYILYTRQQEGLTPAMQRLRAKLSERYPDGRIPQEFRDKFRKESLPLMKYTNILSFNWRTIALFASLFIGQPWLYFAFELVVLNILLVYMMVRHEHICKTLISEV